MQEAGSLLDNTVLSSPSAPERESVVLQIVLMEMLSCLSVCFHCPLEMARDLGKKGAFQDMPTLWIILLWMYKNIFK